MREQNPTQIFDEKEAEPNPGNYELTVTFNLGAGSMTFGWSPLGADKIVMRGYLISSPSPDFHRVRCLNLFLDPPTSRRGDGCSSQPASTRALVNRIRKILPVQDESLRFGMVSDVNLGKAVPGTWVLVKLPKIDPWKWFETKIRDFAHCTEVVGNLDLAPAARNRRAMYLVVCAIIGVSPASEETIPSKQPPRDLLQLIITFDEQNGLTEFRWTGKTLGDAVIIGRVRPVSAQLLSWELERNGKRETKTSPLRSQAIRMHLHSWLSELPTECTIRNRWVGLDSDPDHPTFDEDDPFEGDENFTRCVEETILLLGQRAVHKFSPMARMKEEAAAISNANFASYAARYHRKDERRAQEEALKRETIARLAEERRKKDAERAVARREAEKERAMEALAKSKAPLPIVRELRPVPAVPCIIETPPLAFQTTVFPLANLRGFFLRERAALRWISNQSDDLLCLPYCKIEHLEHQLRTAMRVLGPLRGRALLSDEVGLGKTIEAGLIIKELLTRGMIKRFLVLTVPSLVDQWEEELDEKFGLKTVTTNQSDARSDPQRFWSENEGVVASLHTLKQPAQLEIARQVHWDILIVDEAHYLRNRDSQAWQAVNCLPRQYLLLLTATPVQNSIEELYNLVTLLQPGQLPTPREFRARFVNPKRPREPREPEELRRLLGQVMIRNTRANAGIKLPPRHAETVLFEPAPDESDFWQRWESELRSELSRLKPGQASLWGRLLLQTAGSSPAAWLSSLKKFPNPSAAIAWRNEAPLTSSWRKKCELIPSLTRSEGGAVIFTQFLDTQAALADFLGGAGIEAFVVNGSTPAAERQPITEQFRKRGGALLLTHSGSEGRNLQFCHQLINFDLPWNPMEIEQRIGRLHRLGQQHPVRIYNFVQAGTLQAHLLDILQEKLNLFELVVGETGLVLGERFSSDEFAEEVFRRWNENEGRVAEAFAGLGDELAAARNAYTEIKKLDETLFTQDYESL